MYAITSSSKSSFYALVRKSVPEGDKEKFKNIIRANPRSAIAVEYRKWMEEVFMPLNIRCWDLIVDHAGSS